MGKNKIDNEKFIKKHSTKKKAKKVIKKIEYLKIDLFEEITDNEKDYLDAKKRYVDNYDEVKRTWYGDTFVKNPINGLKKWDSIFSKGIKSWLNPKSNMLSSRGQQNTLNKLNEVIREINKINKKLKDVECLTE